MLTGEGEFRLSLTEILMTSQNFPLLRYDTSGTLGLGLPLDEGDLNAIYPHLDACRQEMLATDMELYAGDPASIPT